jgi:pimeloyl-ACP methyl ester carboxylesterase
LAKETVMNGANTRARALRVVLAHAVLFAACAARPEGGGKRGAETRPAATAARSATGAGRYARVNGLAIYYEVHGTARGDEPPLVLLHGGGSSIDTSFGKVLPALARHRRVIAFDQQGHGRTADVDRPFSFEQSADDAAALLKHLGVARADFMGYSNGGMIAMQVAVRHPRVVRRLVLTSTPFRRDGMVDGFWESMERATLRSMPAELREAYLRVAPDPEKLQSFHDKSVQRMLAFRDVSPDVVRAIAAPTLVMNGDADVVKPEHALALFRLLPHAQLAILPGTDHMRLVGRADWLVSMVEEFLDGPEPGAR